MKFSLFLKKKLEFFYFFTKITTEAFNYKVTITVSLQVVN